MSDEIHSCHSVSRADFSIRGVFSSVPFSCPLSHIQIFAIPDTPAHLLQNSCTLQIIVQLQIYLPAPSSPEFTCVNKNRRVHVVLLSNASCHPYGNRECVFIWYIACIRSDGQGEPHVDHEAFRQRFFSVLHDFSSQDLSSSSGSFVGDILAVRHDLFLTATDLTPESQCFWDAEIRTDIRSGHEFEEDLEIAFGIRRVQQRIENLFLAIPRYGFESVRSG